MLTAPFALVAALTCRPLQPSAPPAAATPPASASPQPPSAIDELYAPRARRRMVRYLRLRLLELQRERLDRVAAAIRDGLPADLILAQEDPAHFCPPQTPP